MFYQRNDLTNHFIYFKTIYFLEFKFWKVQCLKDESKLRCTTFWLIINDYLSTLKLVLKQRTSNIFLTFDFFSLRGSITDAFHHDI
jgi:hypothetical protein